MSHCIKGYLTWLDLTWPHMADINLCQLVNTSCVVLQLTSGACSWSVCDVVDGALCCPDGASSDEDEWCPVPALSALQRSSHPVCSVLTRVQLADVLSQCHQLVSMSVSPFYTVILLVHLITVTTFTLTIYHSFVFFSPHLIPICNTNPFFQSFWFHLDCFHRS